MASGEKTEQTLDSLCAIWEMSRNEASEEAQKLIEIGFFQPRGSRDQPTFWVPFLYRDGLKMSQGLADEPGANVGDRDHHPDHRA